MSFITNSLIKPIAQWYSEINSATLTGAIDVIVVEQEDGSFLTSPFHVRFGKMGVLKAKEKIVDLEINDEPVDIHMKLDDNGTAFFVEDVNSESEDEEIPPELATSPIPTSSQSYMEMALRPKFPSAAGGEGEGKKANRSLISEFNTIEEKESSAVEKDEDGDNDPRSIASTVAIPAEPGTKGKLNRKKRKRRNHKGHARSGSKSSLKDIAMAVTNNNASSSESGEGCEIGIKQKSADDDDDDVFEMENENETPKQPSQPSVPATPLLAPTSTPMHHRRRGSVDLSCSTEQSFLQSRLGHNTIESILDSQEKLKKEDGGGGGGAAAVRPPGSMDYFSEPELNSPQGSRPPSPVLSDTEYETKKRHKSAGGGDKTEQSWEWGKLPKSADHSDKDDTDGKDKDEDEKDGLEKKDGDKAKQRRWWWWKTGAGTPEHKKQEEGAAAAAAAGQANPPPGVYLDDLKDDEEMMALYVGSVCRSSSGEHPRAQSLNPYDDDDAESGNGPSLPMSPHSVDGAIGGRRIRSVGPYDSSDDEQKHASGRFMPDVAVSLCGGLDNPEGKELSSLLFEQSLLTFDDFVLRIRENKDILADPDLVVRIGDKYYNWQTGGPMIMSAVLYGRSLPAELIKEYDEKSKHAASSSPNSKASRSSWWPWRRGGAPDDVEAGVAAGSGSDTIDGTIPGSVEGPIRIEETAATPREAPKSEDNATTAGEEQAQEGQFPVPDDVENESEQLLKIKIEEDGRVKKYKKTLRLSTEAVKQLNLKPGMNEAQFSVTTAYQGTSRCNCHIYWWKSTDKIVVSDIDGTITKSDVLGHVMPIIGRDWAQSGVASLFSKIVANNYHILYLSARAIGQAGITKDYLTTIRQGEVNLPDGPMFLNPTSLVNAFHREVIEKKPEKFKIACLRDIVKLFPSNPLYAGYGNRVNDVYAYRTVGIPISRIFTINSRGELRHELTQTFQTSYDCQSSIVDHVFPPLSGVQNQPSTHQEFSTFAFWREPIVDLRLGKAMERRREEVAAGPQEEVAASPEAAASEPEPAILPIVEAAVKKDKDEKAAAEVVAAAQDKIL